MLQEFIIEIAYGFIAAQIRDVGDGFIGFPKKLAGAVNTELVDIRGKAHVQPLRNHAGNVGFAVAQRLACRTQRKGFLGTLLVAIFHDLAKGLQG